MQLSEQEVDELSPGVRALVVALNEEDFYTTDSGDGSNWESGMVCALPYHSVVIMVPRNRSVDSELARLQEFLSTWDDEEVEYEAEMFTPEPGHPDLLSVQDTRWEEICARVGYVCPTWESLLDPECFPEDEQYSE